MALDPLKAITQYQQDTWQAEHGLAQKSVLVIRQGRDGYIWLGTMDGLIRFDGIRFKTFNKENTKGLQDNFIWALLVDREGRLWIGTWAGGLSCLKDGLFKIYSLEEYPNLKEINTIFQDREGTLWVGTSNNGLICLKNGKFTTYTTDEGLAGKKVHALYEDKEGRLWIGTSAGLFIRDTAGKFTAYTVKNARFDKYINCMCKTKNGALWFGCLDGLYCLNNNTLTYLGKADGLPDSKIKCLFEDNHQNLWVGTENGGLIRVKNGRIETFSPGDELASSHIISMQEDRENNLWIGVFEKGLYRLRDTAIVPYTTREGLNHDTVNCISEDREGNLWIGTKDGVNRLSNEQLTREWAIKEGFLNNSVTAIMEDSEGSLWIGTEAGLYKYKEGTLKSFNDPKGVLYNYILRLWEDKKGAVWILSTKNLSRFHKGKFTVLLNKEDLSNHPFMDFYIDREGSLWIATHGGGLCRQKQGKLTVFTTNEGLAHNEVECFYEDKNGILYIGTRGGLSLLTKGKFTTYTTQNGLMDNYIYHILEDELGHLWLTGRTGPSRISKKELFDYIDGKIEKIKPVLFNQSDGIKNPFCNYGIKTRDGKLWFATDGGLVVIDPANIKKNTLAPPVVIEELIVDGEIFHISKPLAIPPGKIRFEFYYTGLSFVKSRQITFKLKLEGYDSDWVDNGHNRSTTYTGLSPGKYTFMVTARNSDGMWNQKGASFSFYLKPYFYQTTWFHLSATFFVLLIAFSFYRLRVRQLKTRQKELTTLVESRTREVEDKNRQLEDQSEKLKEMDKIKSRFFANISHEFRTPLTLILGPLEQMIAACGEKEKETKRKLILMLRNAQRLLRLINQLLELSKLDSGKMKLQAVKTNITSFLKGITDSFQLLARQKELDLVFHADAEAENIIIYIDPRKMEDIMSNLLLNAVKFTPPGGKIIATINKSFCGGPLYNGGGFQIGSPRRGGLVAEGKDKSPGSFVEISVSDTGPGIAAEQLAHIFDRFYQANSTYEAHEKGSGIGLALAKELVELHHGTIEATSREGEGTMFIIRLPRVSTGVEDIPTESKPSEPREKIPELEMVMEEVENGSETAITEKDIDDSLLTSSGTLSEGAEAFGSAGTPGIILVVEDSADMRNYIRGALEPVYTVVDAEDGQQGIQKAQEIIPDLIISDIMMPGVDGYELCRVLKSDVQTSHIPIILLTAKASEENILQGLETGADDYVTKPFSTNILKARIKNLIDIRSQLQQNLNREMTLRPVKTSVSKIDREFLQELQDVIKKNLSDPEFNVEELCKKLYMSNTTLYRKIQALCGQTPTEFIRSCRLKRAAQLLESGFGSVTEVAFEVGFSSRTYFTKCFKQRFQQLPSDYQETEKR